MSNKNDIGIIGAGLGGLSAAIYLARKGYKVNVFEKNDTVGGKAGNLCKNGFRFDTGPSLLTMPFTLRELFKLNNENIEDYLSVKRSKINCKYFYPDGTFINSYSNPDEFAEEIELKTADSSESVKKYLKYCKNIYDLTSDLFLLNTEIKPTSFLSRKAVKAIINIKKIDPFQSIHKANKNHFRDSKTIQFFDRFATYNGSNPYKAPATLNIIPYVELSLGSFIVKEGISIIPIAMKALAEKMGVKFLFNHLTEKIITEGREVKGIKVNGIDYFFDSVISNVDINYTYKNLLNRKLKIKNELSLSGVVFYWGVKGESPPLEIHNILFSGNYKTEFDDIFLRHKCPDDPTVYIYISAKYKKDDAPEGFENWFVMVNAPFNAGQDWQSEIKRMRKIVKLKIMQILDFDLDKKIIFEEVLSPPDIQNKTGSYLGSIYGDSSNSRISAFRRHPVKSRLYKNLYFSGGSVHPGGGIPLVLLSGKHAAELVDRNLK